MTLKIDGIEWTPEDREEKAVKIEMWYDRHKRHWVLYPVDENGNQLKEAVYGFGKKRSLEHKERT